MSVVTVRRQLEFPLFGAWKWSKTDHETPLHLRLANSAALIYLEENMHFSKRDIIVVPDGRIELVYDPAPEVLIEGLKSKGKVAVKAFD